MRQVGWVFVMLVMLGTGLGDAEEKFGVAVYPGAKYDAATSKQLKDAMGLNGACYRTDDPVDRVAGFYRKQGLASMGEATAEGALFLKGSVNVTLQSPWMNMSTGGMMKDTLISIVQTAQ